MGNTIHSILKQFWGFDSFRPMQLEVIESVLHNNDTVAIMPTGGGKSLCYQLPALAMEGMCLVISPLIALMKDQVENLRKKNITAFAIYSGMSRKEVINTLKIATNSNCKFLYVSPERLETSLFKEWLPGMDINLIAVDEAHCISQWGYDFRPPYLRIAALRDEIPGVPLLALSASATPEVQKDICDKLSLQGTSDNERKSEKISGTKYPSGNWKIFRQSFERPNLSYSVFHVDSKINKIIEILKNVAGSAIVYCKSRKRTKEISELLDMHHISADFYHAGLQQEERNRKQEEWIQNKTRVITCTNAFGMGIDKPDVRLVIHADPPDCLENYYQEAGRAGRDGKMAYAVLLYNKKDLEELQSMAGTRYPSLKDIREVYQAIANYLQIPSGSGEGQYYDFDLSDFTRKFKLNSHLIIYALKAMEQEGLLAFNEQVFIPSTIQFIAGKNVLYEFENTNPATEPLIKTLLRSYEGIFDFPVSISETVLARLLNKDEAITKKELLQLDQNGIIDYNPRKDSPQLVLLCNRMKAEDLRINMNLYNQRKEKFNQRVKNMIGYAEETVACRSKITGRYFGDTQIQNCGICDNCLRQKKVDISRQEFEKITLRIESALQPQPLSSKELLQHLSGIKKEKAWKVIEFLQAENKIELDQNGCVRLK